MRIVVLYGTESGNAELVADEVAEALGSEGPIEVSDLQDFDVLSFDRASVYLVICSTHGEGDLPESARPFAHELDTARPDLSGVRYAMFGMGDSTYENYSRGSEHIDERLGHLGATRFGEYGRHDASARGDASVIAAAWATRVLEEVSAVAQIAASGAGTRKTA